MKPSKDILNELKEIAPALSRLDKKNFYEVSEGYFENSSVKIIELVEDIKNHAIILPPLLASIEKREPHIAPAGYFAAFSDTVITKIHAEEVAEELSYAAPILTGMLKSEAYAVPAAYFAQFPQMVSRLAARDSEAHDSPIALEISRWSMWAERAFGVILRPRHGFAMACMAAMIVVLGIVFTHSTLTPEEKIFAQMQQVPDSELHTYMSRHRDDFDEHTILHHINNIEFTHYFDRPETMPAYLKSGANETTDNTSEDIID